jgi:hypothetical protein
VVPAFAALFGFAVMLLWNWLLPAVAGLPEITFWQALGLLVLSRILLGGIGGVGRGAGGGAMRKAGDHINPFREKWSKMSDDERKEFISKHHFPHSRPFDGFHEDSPPDSNDPNNGKE